MNQHNLIDFIITNSKNNNLNSTGKNIIFIGGAPVTNKTYISLLIQKKFKSFKLIEMESYFKSTRKCRREQDLNGFDKITYDITLNPQVNT